MSGKCEHGSRGQRGGEVKPSELTDEEWAAWPKCAVPACKNKCCLRLRSRYGWPHTPGDALTAQQNLYETEMRQEPAPNPAPTQGGV